MSAMPRRYVPRSDHTKTAQSQSEKQQDFDLALQNWIQMHSTANGVPTATSVGSSGTPTGTVQFMIDNANVGGHAGTPWFEADEAARFFRRHLG